MAETTIQFAPKIFTDMDERLEIILREFELSIRWQRPCILFAVYSSEYVRVDIQNELENYLFDCGQKIVNVRVKERQNQDLIQIISKYEPSPNQIFVIEGLRWGLDDRENLYEALNNQHDYFSENNIRLLFWLTQNEIISLARYAPDLWAQRHQVVEFSESPKGGYVLQHKLESEWQGTGEYDGQYDDTDEKISMRETMLTDIPQEVESSSIRANLLLTLGILHWRRGDFEKADQLLDEAMNLAIKIEDSWFEAECLNARALVYTSLERIDKAIDSYKQAIRLLPGQIFAWNNLGNLCARIGRNDEAIVTFLKAVECNPEDSIAWNGLGNVYKKIGYYDDAIAAYRKSIQFMSSFAQPWNGLGEVYFSMGRFNEAVKTYEQAIQLNKNYPAPWLGLGSLFNKQEQYRDAVKAYQRALAIDGRKYETWNHLGIAQINCSDFEGAERSFLKAIEIDRGAGSAYSNLGFTYAQQGKFQDAISILLRSVEILDTQSDKAVAWNRLGDVYRQLNEYDLAMQAYQNADNGKRIERDAISSSGSTNRQVSEVKNNDESPVSSRETVAEAEINIGALNCVKLDSASSGEILNIKTDAPPFNKKVGDPPSWLIRREDTATLNQETDVTALLSTKGENNMAHGSEKVFQEIQGEQQAQSSNDGTNSVTSAIAWNELGNENFRQENYTEALVSYNKSVQLDPNFGWPYANMGLIGIVQGRYLEAVLLYKKSIELLNTDSDKSIAYNGLGNAYRGLGEYDNAVDAFRKAAELDPENAGMHDSINVLQVDASPKNGDFWNELGNAFLQNGSFREAVTAFQKAAEVNPRDGWAHSNLGRALASMGKHKEAIPAYMKSIELLENNKDKAVSWNRLGNTHRKLNDYDNAIKAFQEAVLLNDEGVNLVTRTRFSLLSNCFAE